MRGPFRPAPEVPMPLYEYRCESCGHRFEALVTGKTKPSCTECGAKKLEKLLSVFAVSGGGKSAEAMPGPGGCGSCGDPRGPGSCRMGGR